MTLKQFVEKYQFTYIDYDKHFSSQCVDLARKYIKDVLNLKQPKSVGGASEFFTNFDKDINLTSQFRKIPNTLWFIPKEGDIMIWSNKYGPYGHIAVVTQATIMYFMAFSQNDPAKSNCNVKKYSYKNVLGVLRKI